MTVFCTHIVAIDVVSAWYVAIKSVQCRGSVMKAVSFTDYYFNIYRYIHCMYVYTHYASYVMLRVYGLTANVL